MILQEASSFIYHGSDNFTWDTLRDEVGTRAPLREAISIKTGALVLVNMMHKMTAHTHPVK